MLIMLEGNLRMLIDKSIGWAEDWTCSIFYEWSMVFNAVSNVDLVLPLIGFYQ